MKKLALIPLVVLIAACQQVPATKLNIPGRFMLDSPKDIHATNVVAGLDETRNFKVSIGSISSVNSPEVIAAVAAANAQMAATMAELVKTVIASGATGALMGVQRPGVQSPNGVYRLERIDPAP